ncbi:MAG: 2,3-bisphosphoglycerate-independent phosphoglycerate mutase [Deltaproteobacteria bacterium]|nr:2,3-bisphosphoglycerate-independent phosphoglycerate mutase [Deltaproteobacteria bacterium]
MTKPLLLMILDGWGLREAKTGNAIELAKTPNYHQMLAHYPHSQIDASGPAVGLPMGVMGNSEVGHLNIGAGRIAQVGLTRIYQAIADGSFFKNSALLAAVQAAKKNHSTLHLMGLLSDGGVHSHQDHLLALLDLAKQQGLKAVMIHVITDGRDTPPQSGIHYLKILQQGIQKKGIGQIATITGRYFVMDRDNRWERIAKAYRALVLGEGVQEQDPKLALEKAYARGETDEFIQPIVISKNSKPIGAIANGDAVIFFNFRADRAREITRALTVAEFIHFERKVFPKISEFVCMMEYDKNFPLKVAFAPETLQKIFPEIISQQGLKQLRIAETEKYAHVTFFFNGGREAVFPGEDRILIPSPREIPTYDLKPEMSAYQVCDRLLSELDKKKYDVIILNFANPDMVGHTAVLPAAIKAVEVVDACLGKVCQKIWEQSGTVIVTADHGNCEQELDEAGKPHTAHTLNLVPFILAGAAFKNRKLRELGKLSDIAPTMLEILGIPKPAEMTGESMLL